VLLLGLALAGVRNAASMVGCSVRLERLSYDDPGTDDEEWLQLSVSNGEGALSFLECGVLALEIVNGDDPGCAAARRIELGSRAIPESGHLVICSAESTVASGWGCDVTESATGALNDGWLQNGPETVRLVGIDEEEIWSFPYGRGGHCSSTPELPEDQGGIEVDGAEVDDVLVRCGEGFARLAAPEAPPRAPARCPDAPTLNTAIASVPLASTGSGDSVPPGEPNSLDPGSVAPANPAGAAVDPAGSATSGSLPSVGGATGSGAVDPLPPNERMFPVGRVFDAGATVVSRAELVEAGGDAEEQFARKAPTSPPKPPELGCAVETALPPRPGVLAAFLAPLLSLTLRRRLGRQLPLRARSCVNCVRRFGRSPSR
jgi:hypothetical protein